MAALLALPGAAERLQLYAADLLLPGSFDEAVAGCDVAIHTASPFALSVRCPRACLPVFAECMRHAGKCALTG